MGGAEGGGFIASPSLKPVETCLAVTSIHLKLPANNPGFRFSSAPPVNPKIGEGLGTLASRRQSKHAGHMVISQTMRLVREGRGGRSPGD